jgi:hypothetical protein
MAYFANWTEGMALKEQCEDCAFGMASCPVYYVQITYNYKACNVPIAREMLAEFVAEDGTCRLKPFVEESKAQPLPEGWFKR